MTIALSDNTPRISYSVSEGVTQTSFTVPFIFFDGSTDLNVFVDNVARTYSPSTSNTTLFTVTGGNGATGTITTTVTGASGGSTVIITRDVPLARTTDFPSAGAFEIAKLNTELDTLLTMITDADDENSRALRLQDSDEAVSLTLPLKADRLGTVLGFNATTGAAEAGPTIADVSSLSAITTDISTLADIEDGTDATDAIQTVAGISGDVTTVAGISGQVTIVAGETTNLQNITDNLSAVQNASTNATLAENYAIKTDGAVESSNYSSKAWALGGTGVTDTAGSGASKEWATDTTNTVDGTEYSAKEYAIGTQSGQTNGSAKQWAIGGGAGFDVNTTVNGSEYSAKYYAELAAASVDSFDDTYLGAKSSDPSVDNDGDALTTGDLYFNTTSNILRVYNGSSWQDAATDTSTLAGQGFAVAMAIALEEYNMAQNFRQYKMREIGTSATDIPDGSNFDSYDCLISIRMTNITTNAITCSAYIQNTSLNYYLIKDVTIPAHSSLELIDGGSKIVVESGDRLYFVSDTATSLDVIVSAVDAIST